MPLTVDFQGREPITQDIDEEYNMNTNYNDDYDVFVNPSLDNYINSFTEIYKRKEDEYLASLQSQQIPISTDYGMNSAIFFGFGLDDVGNTIEKIKEINEEEKYEEEKNDIHGPCFNMIKYTKIRDSAIMPCKSIIASTREFDSAIMPCKYIIDSVRQIDAQFVKNQKPSIGPLESQLVPSQNYKIVDPTGRRYNILGPPTGRPSKPGLNKQTF